MFPFPFRSQTTTSFLWPWREKMTLCLHSVVQGFLKCDLLTGNQSNLQQVTALLDGVQNQVLCRSKPDPYASVPHFFFFCTTQVIQDYSQVGKITPQKQLCSSIFLPFSFLASIFLHFKDFTRTRLLVFRPSWFWYIFYKSSWSWVSRGC